MLTTQHRRERTFVGSVCVVCEEPLEHTLRGEHILQLTCGHISHEACLYEYVSSCAEDTCPTCEAQLEFDTSRGGNIDYDSLHRLISAAQNAGTQWKQHSSPSTTNTFKEVNIDRRSYMAPMVVEQEFPLEDQSALSSRLRRRDHYARVSSSRSQSLTRSAEADSVMSQPSICKKCEDMHATNAPAESRQLSAKFPIPDPAITLRSEFPTITRSRTQQTLTCMITIDVAESTWPSNPVGYQRSSIGTSSELEESWTKSASTQTTLVDTTRSAYLRSRAVVLEAAKENMLQLVDDWHGLDPKSFGNLLLYGPAKVGKDQKLWQEVECYLFNEILVCVKARRNTSGTNMPTDDLGTVPSLSHYTLKGSIMIKKHLNEVHTTIDCNILTLRLAVNELPTFHLLFGTPEELQTWSQAMHDIDWNEPHTPDSTDVKFAKFSPYDHSTLSSIKEVLHSSSDIHSLPELPRAHRPEPFRSRSDTQTERAHFSAPLHVPVDIVIVLPVPSSGHSLKVNVLRDAIRFVLSILGDCDRLGIVSFGSEEGAHTLAPLSTTHSTDWQHKLDLIKSSDHKSAQVSTVQAANVAMDLLARRKSTNPLTHILLISDATQADNHPIDEVVSRAENFGVSIHTFGLGVTHNPVDLVSIASRSKASYSYVKDWMMLRECLAGCVGSLQSTSHQNAKLEIWVPEGSTASLVKVSGALQATITGSRSAEISLGDLRYGDRRDVLVQLTIQTDKPTDIIQDPWESMVSDLGGTSPIEARPNSDGVVEELPLLEVDLEWGDVLHAGRRTQLAQESLLAITQLPMETVSDKLTDHATSTLAIPPHPCIQQRRLELLTSDMLARALALVDKGQTGKASQLLSETRSILQGLWKGPAPAGPATPPHNLIPIPPKSPRRNSPPARSLDGSMSNTISSSSSSMTSHRQPIDSLQPTVTVDPAVMTVLDFELSANLEWISHPDVFARDARKAILQAIGVISSQRGYTCRSPAETLWASRITGVKRALDRSREWREVTRGTRAV